MTALANEFHPHGVEATGGCTCTLLPLLCFRISDAAVPSEAPSSAFISAEWGMPTTARFPPTSESSKDGNPGEWRHMVLLAGEFASPVKAVQAWLGSALR